jgi:type VI secretion system protein ImpJ
MALDDKVVWYEGMFLRPQHFQQQDRYVERLVRARSDGLVPYGWGLSELKIDRQLLETGKFALQEAVGLFDDGTPFSVPSLDDLPPALDLPEGSTGKRVFLAVPERRPNVAEFGAAEGSDTISRYDMAENEVFDNIAGSTQSAPVNIGKLRLKYLIEGESAAGYALVGVARLQEVRSDRKAVLDDGYIPPVLNTAASPTLAGFLTELAGLLRHRGEAMAGRIAGAGGARGVSDVADFMMLQAINRYEPVLAHLSRIRDVHPERVYALMVGIAGELSTFTAKGRRPPSFPDYRHDDLQASFKPVVETIRQCLSAVLEQPAVQIPLQERGHGIRVGTISDKRLLRDAGFVLAVRSDMPQEQIRKSFPRLVKIGPVEQIRELVNVALPGIRIRPMPVAPRQIPFHSTAVYFELERGTQIWKQLATSGGIALHVAGDFPQLSVELWAIRG